MNDRSGRFRRRLGSSLVLALGLTVGSAETARARPHEGAEPEIRRVEFTGNRFYSARELERWMRQRPSSVFFSIRYRPAELLQDLERLRRLYIGEGFLDVAIDAEVDSTRRADRTVDLHVVVAEGERWRLLSRELELKGPESTPDLADSIFRALEVSAPGPYRLRALVTDREKIFRILAGRGLLDSRVEVLVARDDSCRSARLRFQVDTGPRARVRDLQVRGRRRTRPDLIRRELALQEGELVRPATLAATRANLLRTGLFSRVEVEPSERDGGRAEKTIVVSVQESPAGTLGGGIGYGTSDHARFAVALEHRNVSGRGVRAALRGIYGERRRGAEAELNMPRTLGRRIATTLTAHHERVSPPSYSVERSGGSVHFARILDRSWKVDLGYVVEQVHLLDGGARSDDGRSHRLGHVSTSLTRDSRNDLFLPSRGAYGRLQLDWNSPLFGSRHRFVRTGAEHRSYLSLGSVVLAARLRQGWIAAQDAARSVPITERYLAGGIESLRGFPEGSVGPSDSLRTPIGGEFLSLGAAELRVPITSGLSAAAFCDAGQLASRAEELAWRSVSVGAGLSLQVRVPVGRLRCSVAWPVTRRFGDGAQFYVGSGSAF